MSFVVAVPYPARKLEDDHEGRAAVGHRARGSLFSKPPGFREPRGPDARGSVACLRRAREWHLADDRLAARARLDGDLLRPRAPSDTLSRPSRVGPGAPWARVQRRSVRSADVETLVR